jgi:hypothetical protein
MAPKIPPIRQLLQKGYLHFFLPIHVFSPLKLILVGFVFSCSKGKRGRPARAAAADDAPLDISNVSHASGSAAQASNAGIGGFPREKLLSHLRELELDVFEVCL